MILQNNYDIVELLKSLINFQFFQIVYLLNSKRKKLAKLYIQLEKVIISVKNYQNMIKKNYYQLLIISSGSQSLSSLLYIVRVTVRSVVLFIRIHSSKDIKFSIPIFTSLICEDSSSTNSFKIDSPLS